MKNKALLVLVVILSFAGYISLSFHLQNKIQQRFEEIQQVYTEVQELRYRVSLLEKEIANNYENNLENTCNLKNK
jgi:cytoskeletal protein RodZ